MSAVLEQVSQGIRMTADEFADSIYARGFELVEGIVVPRNTSPRTFLKEANQRSTGTLHGIVTSRLTAYLTIYVIENDLGETCAAETGFRLTPNTVRGADLAFIRKEKLEIFGIPINFFPTAPDLAVEVISPSNTYDEIQDKIEKYFASGTKLIWIVDPKRRKIFVHRPDDTVSLLNESDMLDGEDVIIKFRLPLEKIFGKLSQFEE
ncbi:MAG: Uma2 family endonuclease [Pyrinomonadaceae bacterium]|nr:Uma2 family endonuclease [Pyrinomonadaceae bacterium]